MKRRNKNAWLKDNPEWREWTWENDWADKVKVGMMVQVWFPKEKEPRLGLVTSAKFRKTVLRHWNYGLFDKSARWKGKAFIFIRPDTG